jgi:ubiquinone/menaquinone biosynthesis C-methylase UbiE
MVTAVDASIEMINVNRAKVASDRVTYIQADLFSWQPECKYDAVIFCFFISHIPYERLDAFLALIATMVHPGGKIFFVDGQREPLSTAIDHRLPEPEQQTMIRLLNDGRSFEIVKNFYEQDDLTSRCSQVGLNINIQKTATYFFYGIGTR